MEDIQVRLNSLLDLNNKALNAGDLEFVKDQIEFLLSNVGNEASLKQIAKFDKFLQKHMGKAFEDEALSIKTKKHLEKLIDIAKKLLPQDDHSSQPDKDSLDVIAKSPESTVSHKIHNICDKDLEIQNNFDIESTLGSEFLLKFANIQIGNLQEFENAILEFEQGSKEAQELINRILHTLKGDFGVLGLTYYSQLIHHVEDLFLSNSLTSDTLFLLKDFFQERFLSFLDLKVPPITEADVNSLFNYESAIETNEIKNVSQVILPFDQDKELLPSLIEDSEIAYDFITESLEHLDKSESLLMELERSPNDTDIMNTLFRICHTVKGVAGFIGLQVITKFSHELESTLSQARKGEISFNSDDISLLLSCFDMLKQLIEGLKLSLSTGQLEFPNNLEALFTALTQDEVKEKTASPIEQQSVNIDIGTTPSSDVDVNPSAGDNIMDKASSNDNSVVPENKPTVSVQNPQVTQQSPASNVQQTNTKQSKTEETIRVQTDKLDQLIDAIGETVIAQSMIAADPIIQDAEDLILEKKIGQSNLLIRQIQELSMSLRMVPVKGTFQKMARLVRDLSKKMGKPIDFQMEGENTELDKTVVENIADPLMHMVRNSVDHGIETPEERAISGKDEKATIILRSFNKGGSIFIEIQDDGRGLNRDAIVQKAIKNGLIQNDEGLSDQDVFRFIFNPGFSTAQQVTDLSGRGVGMDVVKKNIEALRGSIGITSTPGSGTNFSIRLPLTLAIIDGMIVKCSEHLYILPTLSMVETVKAQDSETVITHDGTQLLKIRDSLIPLCQLDKTLGFSSEKLELSDSIVVIVEDMVGSKLGVIVHEIIGQQQIVIKSLGKWLGEIPGLAGGTIMNTGNVSLIVDIAGLIQLFNQSKIHVSSKTFVAS